MVERAKCLGEEFSIQTLVSIAMHDRELRQLDKYLPV